MSSSGLTFSLFIVVLLNPPLSTANLHKASQLRSQSIHQSLYDSVSVPGDAPPTTYFEVTKPIPLRKDKTCSYVTLKHDFGYTDGQSPVLASYQPPPKCNACNSSKIVLEWTATSIGRQFDRIFGVWLGGVEILRSCTAEPRKNGIIWTVKKDVTRYHSLLTAEKGQTLAVYLGNIVNDVYTGVYNASLSFHFYHSEALNNSDDSDDGFLSRADLILPISRNLPLKDGLWFEIENSTDVARKELKIPQNAFRAVLEVYVSFHENDEFWYGNYPNDYISLNNLSAPGNGPFREVVVKVDDLLVGAVWPFTVIYTGGVNPLFWRPITGIGSFDLPTYDIELTPFLGRLLDGKNRTFALSVTNALNVWYVNANLHLWLDKKSDKTQGKLLRQRNSPLFLSNFWNISGSDVFFSTNASRSVVSIGWVKSSHGVINTTSRQEFEYSNVMRLGNQANLQIFDQTIKLKSSVDFTKPSSKVGSTKLRRQFHVSLHSGSMEKGNNTQVLVDNVTLGFYEKRRRNSCFGSKKGTLKNWQNGYGYLFIENDTVVGGLGTTRQDYRYSGGKTTCYSRNVSSSNYTILHDEERNSCRN